MNIKHIAVASLLVAIIALIVEIYQDSPKASEYPVVEINNDVDKNSGVIKNEINIE